MKTRRKPAAPGRAADAPFLRRITSLPEKTDAATHPFNVRAFSHGIDLTFRSRVTFFVGENGSGKSTLLEALAECCGFNPATWRFTSGSHGTRMQNASRPFTARLSNRRRSRSRPPHRIVRRWRGGSASRAEAA